MYGNLLTEKKKKIFSYYYEENFSLTEIASLLKITKQAVSEQLHKTKDELLDFEKKLKLIKNGV